MKLRREVKILIAGLVGGFLFCLGLWAMVVTASASELEPESVEVDESTSIVQGEQPEAAAELSIETVEPLEDVQSEQSEVEPAQVEPVQPVAGSYIELTPFASGAIIGQLADLLQENVIDNDGYTEESWQRYETAMAAGWAVIGNFMAYTNDEVQAVIDEINAAIAGLEYPAGNPPPSSGTIDLEGLGEFVQEITVFVGFLCGLLVVLTVSGGMRNAT